MADQVQNAAPKAPGPAGGVQDKVQSATTGILGKIEGFGGWVAMKGTEILDRVWPPESRNAFLAKIQAFMLKNPKLSSFLGMNLALTGVPLGLFVLFSLTVAIFSLVVGLVLGLLAAVLFTLFAVGVALTIVLPTIFFTTMTACFLFLWGLGGYYILKWANSDDKEKGADTSGPSIGDRLNNLTGGRLTGFMQSAKDERSKGDISGFSDEHTKPNYGSDKKEGGGQANGSAHKENVDKAQKEVGNAATKATKATGVDNAQGKVANTTGTVKGGVSGVSGLA